MPHLLLLVLLVATTNKYFEEQELVAGTKQSMQAEKAVRSAYFVLCPLLALALERYFFAN